VTEPLDRAVPAPKVRERDQLLDAWRGFSVLLVVCYHAVFYRFGAVFRAGHAVGNNAVYWEVARSDVARAMLELIVYWGPLGVKFFFVISGYIITRIMLAERQTRGTISMRAFYLRRACRILPPLWIYLACLWAATYAGWINVTSHSFFYALSFLCNASIHACYSEWFLAHLWSLSVEEQFYLVWPLVVVLAMRRLLSIAALGFLSCFLLAAQMSLLFVGEFNNGLSFACISAGALYASSGRLREAIALLATLPAIALAILLLFARPFIPLMFPGQFRLHDILTPALICFVMFSSFQYRISLESRILTRALASIGLISYGLYVWQQVFLAPPELYLKASFLTQPYLLIPAVLISYLLVERPFIRLGVRACACLREKYDDSNVSPKLGQAASRVV
jgi:peptidoglycan/LPS O-acetylase OafA/YrhL